MPRGDDARSAAGRPDHGGRRRRSDGRVNRNSRSAWTRQRVARAVSSALWKTAACASRATARSPSDGWSKGRISGSAGASPHRSAPRCSEAEAQARSLGGRAGGRHGRHQRRGRNSRGVYEFGRPREIDAAMTWPTPSSARRECAWSTTACCCSLPAGFHAGRPRRLSQSTRRHLLAPGSQRPHRHRLRAGAPGAGRAPCIRRTYAVEETVFEPVAAAYACVTAGGSRPRRRAGRYRHAFHRPGGLRRRSGAAGAQHCRSRPTTSRATSRSA